MKISRPLNKLWWIALFIVFSFSEFSYAQESKIQWLEGPQKTDLGTDIAEIDVPSGYLFADGDNTRTVMKALGNPPSNTEIGMILNQPQSEDEHEWFVVFEYDGSGYIPDDEKDELDAEAILETLREGNEAGNEWRKENGFPPVYIKGWHQKPFYDSQSNNLTWATLLGDETTSNTVNHNIRLLGRKGHVSATVVGDPETLNSNQSEINSVLTGFSFKPGNKYSEYVEGDKIAEYGLVALIAGGAGAAAMKFGLFGILAKYWKALVVAVVGLFASLRKSIGKLFRGNKQDPE